MKIKKQYLKFNIIFIEIVLCARLILNEIVYDEYKTAPELQTNTN